MRWIFLIFMSVMAMVVHAADKPNMIYIMIDDAGYADFGAFGSKDVKTPVFDQMCAEGTRFTQHYSGSAVCAPTRCVLMTGLDTGHCRRRDNKATANLKQTDENGLVFLKPQDVTFAEQLKKIGYVTGGIGKWGLGNPDTDATPDKHGFDHFLGYLDQVHAHDYYTDWLWEDGKKIQTHKRYSHYIFEDDTLRFIHKNKDKPFFLYLPYTLPHGHYVIPEDDPAYLMYKDKPWPQEVRNYAAMITRVDMTVGKIMALLKELGIDDNTLVFYTSDNGPNKPFVKDLKSGGPLRGLKRSLYEGGLRAAMTVRWPGHVPAGVVSDFVWDMRDVFPTLCDLTGAPKPTDLDGISVLPTLLGKTQPPRDHLYWEIYHPFQQAVRMGSWKGIRFGVKDPIELYDLIRDVGETKNVAASHPDIVEKLRHIMDESHTPTPFWPLVEHARKSKQKG